MSVQQIGVYPAPRSEPACEPASPPRLYVLPTPHRQLSLLPLGSPGGAERQHGYAHQPVDLGLPGALERYFGPQHTPSTGLPPVQRSAQVFCTAVAEVLTGFRPGGQLREQCSPAVYTWVEANTSPRPRTGGIGRRPQVSAVRVCETADGIAEVSAVVHRGPRSRAMAARLEGVDGDWRCVHLQVV